jgi:hypothetical protein
MFFGLGLFFRHIGSKGLGGFDDWVCSQAQSNLKDLAALPSVFQWLCS